LKGEGIRESKRLPFFRLARARQSPKDPSTSYIHNTEFLTPCAQGEGVQGDKVTLALGETLQLDLTIVPSHVNVVDPVWTSSDESVVTVSETGLLTAVKSGEAIIHVYSEYNPEIYDDLTVKVSGGAVGISKKLIDQKDAD